MKDQIPAFCSTIWIAGDIMTMLAYFLLQTKRLSAQSPLFLVLNCLGSTLILVPLVFQSSLASILDQMVWFGISLYGVFQNLPNWIRRRYFSV